MNEQQTLIDDSSPSRCAVCQLPLKYHEKSNSWVCPTMLHETTFAGLIEPKKSAAYRRRPAFSDERALVDIGHVTCLPAELFDDSEVTPAIRFARGQGYGDPTAPAKGSDGRRTIVDERGVPLSRSDIRMGRFITYECDDPDCGVRHPSEFGMRQHLARTGHPGAENGRGDRIER